jgi:hypothetical protein
MRPSRMIEPEPRRQGKNQFLGSVATRPKSNQCNFRRRDFFLETAPETSYLCRVSDGTFIHRLLTKRGPACKAVAMIPFATFDSEALTFLQAALEHAWRSLPSDRRTPQSKDRMAKAVMRSAAQGERDPARLNAIAVAAVIAEPADAYDIEVRQGDETMSSLRSVELPNSSAVWGHIAELAKKVSAPKARIRVMDQSGEILISIGIAAARLLKSA